MRLIRLSIAAIKPAPDGVFLLVFNRGHLAHVRQCDGSGIGKVNLG